MPQQLKLVEKIRNFHFWVILALIAGIIFIYYDWFWRYEWFWYVSLWEFRFDIIGSLLFIPFLYASLAFGLRGAVIVWLIALIAILPRMVLYSYSFLPFMRNMAMAFVPLATVITLALEITWRNRQRQISADRDAERQLYVAQILRAQEDERRRVRQELHDGAIQELLIIANKAQDIIDNNTDQNTDKRKVDLEYIRDSGINLTEDLRRISVDLRPSVLDNLGLMPAVRWIAEKLTKESKIVTEISMDGVVRKLSPENEVTIFRVIQEALNNIQRHSNATKAMINLSYMPDSLKVIIKDNGKGFYFNENFFYNNQMGQIGLMGINQRIKLLNGNVEMTSQIDKGTSLTFSIPL